MKHVKHKWARRAICAMTLVMAIVISVGTSLAQQGDPREGNPLDRLRRGVRSAFQSMAIPKSRLRDGPQVRAAFRSAVDEASHATVRIEADGEKIALGGIVGADGWIVTKASRLKQNAKETIVKLRDGRSFVARLVGIDLEHDLAMLKVEGARLPALDLSHQQLPAVGDWVAATGITRDPQAVGVISVLPRSIPKRSGILGVTLDDTEDGRPVVIQVAPESGAARAGILVNDVIVAVNDEPTETREDLIRTIREYSPGERVRITVERDGETQRVAATLTDRVEGMSFDRGRYQNNLGSELSRRRYGFPSAMQHDVVLRPIDCGGPLVNLDGQVVGINIARGGRTESYAIPTSVVVSRLFELMSGNLAPIAEESATQTAHRSRDANTGDSATGKN